MKYDFAVIGAGIAGLTASLILAGCGFQVVLIEKAPGTAGMVRGFRRRKVQFDTGFHYAGGLGKGDILDRFFRHLGVADRLLPEPLDPEGFDIVRCRRPPFEFRFPYGPGRLRERLLASFPRERAGIDRFLQEIGRAGAAFPYMNLEADLAPPEGLQGPTLQELLDQLTGDRLLQGVLSVHTLLHGIPPAEVPFALHAVVAGPYYRSAHTLRGGGRSLAEAFDAELARRGVEVVCGDGAEAILLGGDGRPCGVRLAGGRILACSACVAAVHPRTLLDLVPAEAFRPVYRRRLSALAETPSACLLFGEAAQLPAELQRANLFLLPEPEAAGQLEAGVEGGPLYLTAGRRENGEIGGFLAISPLSAGIADAWRDTAHSHRPQEYRTFKAGVVRKMQEQLELFCPELANSITWSEGATPLTLRDFGHSPTGSLYGVRHRAGQIAPAPVTRVPGLWLAGQGVAAPGVLGAMISAYLACGEIVGHGRLREELSRCR